MRSQSYRNIDENIHKNIDIDKKFWKRKLKRRIQKYIFKLINKQFIFLIHVSNNLLLILYVIYIFVYDIMKISIHLLNM